MAITPVEQIMALLLQGAYIENRALGRVGEVTAVHPAEGWIEVKPLNGRRITSRVKIGNRVELIKVGPNFWHIRNKNEDLKV